MAEYPETLPTTTMPDASPTRKIFKSNKLEQPKLQVTATSKKGNLAFLRAQGITSLNLANQRKSRV